MKQTIGIAVTEGRLCELASLTPVEYDHRRKQEAKALGIRTSTLDEEIIKRKAETPGRNVRGVRGNGGATFTLPLPPLVNHMYMTVGTRRILSPEARVYKEEVGVLMLALRETLVKAIPTLYDDTACSLTAYMFFKTRRRDVDSGHKVLQDAIFEGLGIDDKAVEEIHIYKRHDQKYPRAVVTLDTIT